MFDRDEDNLDFGRARSETPSLPNLRNFADICCLYVPNYVNYLPENTVNLRSFRCRRLHQWDAEYEKSELGCHAYVGRHVWKCMRRVPG